MSKVKCKYTAIPYRNLDLVELIPVKEIAVLPPGAAAIMEDAEVEVKIDGGKGFSDLSEYKDTSPSVGEEGVDDFVNIGPDMTQVQLDKCEKYVLRPYRVVLRVMGWAPFTRYGDSAVYKILRAMLIGFWLAVILITCLTQILSCFRRDSTLPGRRINITNKTTDDVSTYRGIQCEEHVISAFVLTDLLLLASYIFGLYLFSRGETEYLSNLASKVFIQSGRAKQVTASNHLVWTIMGYFILAVVWILLSLIVRIMTIISVEMWSDSTIIMWSNNVTFNGSGKRVLIVLDIFGFVFFDMIYVMAVMNYAAQSEMNIYLLSAIQKLVQDKGYGQAGLDGSIKDIIESRKYLRVLNGKTSTATALILFNLGSAGITAIINLNKISSTQVAQFVSTELATVTAGFNVILWVALVSFPFLQAARVTDACLKVKAMGPELRARPQLYAGTPQLELDSYVTLTQAVKLRATMFGVPIFPWMWWALFSGISFTALILFQTGVYNFTRYL